MYAALGKAKVNVNEGDELFFHVALLAGVGSAARARLDLLGRPAEASQKQSCVEGGLARLMSLVAGPGAPRWAIARVRHSEARWASVGLGGQGPAADHVFAGETEQAFAFARALGPEVCAEVDRQGERLNTRGALFRLTIEHDGRVQPSWQLHRGASPSNALAALGRPDAWEIAEPLLARALGRSPNERTGPYAVGAVPGSESVLLGTTALARCIDNEARRRRLVDLLSEHGADAGFAEATYKLCHGGRRRGARGLVLEVGPAGVTRVELVMAVGDAHGNQTSGGTEESTR